MKIQRIERTKGKPEFRVKITGEGKRTTHTFRDELRAQKFSELVNSRGVAKAREVYAIEKYSTGKADKITKNLMLTVEDYCVEYAKSMPGGVGGVTNEYRKTCLAYANKLGCLANVPLDAVNRQLHRAYLRELEARGLSPKTIKNYNGFLMSALKNAAYDGIINFVPSFGNKLPKIDNIEMNPFSKEEFRLFINFVDPHYRDFVTVAVFTGMRLGEITALESSAVDSVNRTIRIAKAWGDGNMRLKSPKTKKGYRTIAINDLVFNILRARMEKQSALHSIGDKPFLFTNKHGGRIRTNSVEYMWHEAIDLFNGNRDKLPKWAIQNADHLRGLPVCAKHIRFHDLRHTFASWMLSAGIPIHIVSAYLGHTSIETTVKRYGHLMPDDHELVRSKMNEVLAILSV